MCNILGNALSWFYINIQTYCSFDVQLTRHSPGCKVPVFDQGGEAVGAVGGVTHPALCTSSVLVTVYVFNVKHGLKWFDK